MAKNPLEPLNPLYFTGRSELIYTNILSDLKAIFEIVWPKLRLRFIDIQELYIIGPNIEGTYDNKTPLVIQCKLEIITAQEQKDIELINKELSKNNHYYEIGLQLIPVKISKETFSLYYDLFQNRVIHNEVSPSILSTSSFPVPSITPPITPPITAPQPIVCPQCKSTLEREGMQFCPYCGYELKPTALITQGEITPRKPSLREKLQKAKKVLKEAKTEIESTSKSAVKWAGLPDANADCNIYYYDTLLEIIFDFNLFEAWKEEIRQRFLRKGLSLADFTRITEENWEEWQGNNWEELPISRDFRAFLVKQGKLRILASPDQHKGDPFEIAIAKVDEIPLPVLNEKIAQLFLDRSKAHTEVERDNISSKILALNAEKTRMVNQSYKQFENLFNLAKELNLFQGLKNEIKKDIFYNNLRIVDLEQQLGVRWEDWEGASAPIVLKFIPYNESIYREWLIDQARGRIIDLIYDQTNKTWLVRSGDQENEKEVINVKYRLWIYPKEVSYTEPLLQGEFDTYEEALEEFNTKPAFKAYEAHIEEFPTIFEGGLMYQLNDRIARLRASNKNDIYQFVQDHIRYVQYNPESKTWESFGLNLQNNRVNLNWEDLKTEEKNLGDGFFCNICNRITAHPLNHAEEHLLTALYLNKQKQFEEQGVRVKVQCKGHIRNEKGPRCTRWTYNPSGYCAQHDPDRPFKARKKARRLNPSPRKFSPEVMRSHLEEILLTNPFIKENLGLYTWGELEEFMQRFSEFDLTDVTEEENLSDFFQFLVERGSGGGVTEENIAYTNIMAKPWEQKKYKPSPEERARLAEKEKEEQKSEEEWQARIQAYKEGKIASIWSETDQSPYYWKIQSCRAPQKGFFIAKSSLDREITLIRQNAENQLGRFIRRYIRSIQYDPKNKNWDRYGLRLSKNRVVIDPLIHTIESSIFQNVFICEACGRLVINPRNHAEDHLIERAYFLSIFASANKLKVYARSVEVDTEKDALVFYDHRNNITYRVFYRQNNPENPRISWTPEQKEKRATFSIEILKASFSEEDGFWIDAVPLGKGPFAIMWLNKKGHFIPGFSLRFAVSKEKEEEAKAIVSEWDKLWEYYQLHRKGMESLVKKIKVFTCKPMGNVTSSYFGIKDFSHLVYVNQALNEVIAAEKEESPSYSYGHSGYSNLRAYQSRFGSIFAKDVEKMKEGVNLYVTKLTTNAFQEIETSFQELKMVHAELEERIRKASKFTTKLQASVDNLIQHIQRKIILIYENLTTIYFHLQLREEYLAPLFIGSREPNTKEFADLDTDDIFFFPYSETKFESGYHRGQKETHINFGKYLAGEDWKKIALSPTHFSLHYLSFDETSMTGDYKKLKEDIEKSYQSDDVVILQVSGRSQYNVRTVLLGDNLLRKEPINPNLQEVHLKKSDNFSFDTVYLLYKKKE